MFSQHFYPIGTCFDYKTNYFQVNVTNVRARTESPDTGTRTHRKFTSAQGDVIPSCMSGAGTIGLNQLKKST